VVHVFEDALQIGADGVQVGFVSPARANMQVKAWSGFLV